MLELTMANGATVHVRLVLGRQTPSVPHSCTLVRRERPMVPLLS